MDRILVLSCTRKNYSILLYRALELGVIRRCWYAYLKRDHDARIILRNDMSDLLIDDMYALS